jgi:hypothetical protein
MRVGPSLMLCRELAGFTSFDDVLRILYCHWPVETLPESFSRQSSRCYVRTAHSSMDFPHEFNALILRDAFEQWCTYSQLEQDVVLEDVTFGPRLHSFEFVAFDGS